jgi:hypothetical protein
MFYLSVFVKTIHWVVFWLSSLMGALINQATDLLGMVFGAAGR